MNDPWQALAEFWPWIPIYVRILPGKWGQTVWDGGKPYIELAYDLGPIQQRCTLAHEMFHLEAGQPCADFCSTNERDIVKATARWLLPDVEEIGAALRDQDVATAARSLRVTVQVLTDRLHYLDDSEGKQLAAALLPGAGGEGVRAADWRARRSVEPTRDCPCTEPSATPGPRDRSTVTPGSVTRTTP